MSGNYENNNILEYEVDQDLEGMRMCGNKRFHHNMQ